MYLYTHNFNHLLKRQHSYTQKKWKWKLNYSAA